MKKVSVVMLGSTGVGKTSTLATMFKETLVSGSESEFKIEAKNEETVNYLQDALSDLKAVERQGIFEKVPGFLDGTIGVMPNSFNIRLQKKKYMELNFFDVQGGFINLQSIKEDKEQGRDKSITKEKFKNIDKSYNQFINLKKTADIFINIIDGAALMGGDNEYFKNSATPFIIQNIIQERQGRKNKKILFLFVITKCERWLETRGGRRELEDRFSERYKEVIETIENYESIAAIMIPIATLGCVKYHRWNRENNRPVFLIMNVNDNKLRTKYVDQPLYYIMTFALARQYENRSWLYKFWAYITGKQRKYKDAFTALERKRNSSFPTYGAYRELIRHNRLR